MYLYIWTHIYFQYHISHSIYFQYHKKLFNLLPISQKIINGSFWYRSLYRFIQRRKKILEDSAPRSRKYLKRDHAAANQRLIDDYFANEPTYDDAMFRRRYQMQKHVFLRIVGDLSSSDNYFTQRVDAANKEGISPLAKCTTTMWMLAYGVAANVVD